MGENRWVRLAPLMRTGRQLTALAAPIAGVQFAQVALTTTDLAMMGLIGVQAIAAGGLAAILYNLMRTMCVGVVTAVGNLVATAAAQGEARSGSDRPDTKAHTEIRQINRSAFLVATLTAVLLGAALIALGYVLPVFGVDKDVLALARPMMIALAPGLVPMVWLNVLRQFSVGMRRPGPLLAVSIASIALNAALDLVFIYGLLGLPGWAWRASDWQRRWCRYSLLRRSISSCAVTITSPRCCRSTAGMPTLKWPATSCGWESLFH